MEGAAGDDDDIIADLFLNLEAAAARPFPVPTRRPALDDDDDDVDADGDVDGMPAPVTVAKVEVTDVVGEEAPSAASDAKNDALRIDVDMFASNERIAKAFDLLMAFKSDMIRQCRQMALALLKHWAAPPLKIGLIGCGMMGGALLAALCDAGVPRRQIMVSTRRPDAVTVVPAVHNNAKVLSQCQLVFLCVLPHQVNTVARDCRRCLPGTAILYSMQASVPVAKLKRAFRSESIIAYRPVNDDPAAISTFANDVAVATRHVLPRVAHLDQERIDASCRATASSVRANLVQPGDAGSSP
ncbi:Pyrroline-5-carboxylate reductase catalytic N-terminal domain-containing protein [Plasmodiophora brassicae]|uniref:Pyrroline-5-carboxylate reductase catalytic N-terminal domain-containing protein n=1 Tax=Plasmodiophora brassicae TaxID=37360 RepID=A0A3P3Y2V2_PLABS|nr:unnamed protein product [Plasmodiophora brassicae]